MISRDFRQVGHSPTLLTATLYFGVTTTVWLLFGGLASTLGDEFSLTNLELGLLVAVPSLGGALLRLVLGVLTDRIGARRTGLLSLIFTVVPLLLGWQWADSFNRLLVVGLFLGVAGASFAVALPLVSRWYPARHQGLAMGIVGLGYIGSAVIIGVAPYFASSFGWHAVFGAALVPVLVMLVLFFLFAKDSSNQPAPKKFADYVAMLKEIDTWRFCFFYGVTFGGFIGLASYLSIYFVNQYGLSRGSAGACSTLCVLAGSLLRPVGGYLADRIGGISLLTVIYAGVGLLTLDLATTAPLAWTLILCVAIMAMLGLGNGAVFQLVPQRFSKEIGVVTGIIGAAGGVGGFLLPTLLGSMRHLTGSFSGGFLLLSLIAFVSIGVLVSAGYCWEGVYVAKGGLAQSGQLKAASEQQS